MTFLFFFFNDTATTEIYTLSLHDALPICRASSSSRSRSSPIPTIRRRPSSCWPRRARSEEHTSELQSRLHLVCRLLLEKKKKDGPTIRSYAKEYHARARQSAVIHHAERIV